jgi:methanogenic corrinoid protein MtbC1
MAGEIMRQVSDLVQPALQDRFVGHVNGRVLVGTVRGDIHYIGKNIFKILLQCFGFTVSDVGEDVTPDEMLKQSIVFSPHVIGLSCLVTAAYDAMRETVSHLRAGTGRRLDPPPKIIVGGMVDETVCQYVGADRWSRDAMDGVRICQDFLQSISTITETPR